MSTIALDTSAAIPFLMRSHPAHALTLRHVLGRTAVLTTQSLAETYSVLTRLPGDARLKPIDAAALLGVPFLIRSHQNPRCRANSPRCSLPWESPAVPSATQLLGLRPPRRGSPW